MIRNAPIDREVTLSGRSRANASSDGPSLRIETLD